MHAGHPQICLYQPEIPQNAGNIGRLSAATGCRLHLIRPFGFATDDRNLRRPGLDYWPFLDLEIHDDIEPLFQRYQGKLAFFSKMASKVYTEVPTDTELFIFGRETTGLPEEWHTKYQDAFYRIPIFHPGVRSLNLANAVSIVIYDQLSRRERFN
ncbi:MAG: tRNA (cytidine(34)-2'-O)-methyltransferase [Oligoflexus sp.]